MKSRCEIKNIRKLLKTISESNQPIVIIDGFKVKNKEKYGIFLRKGVSCKCCGSKAEFIRIEKDENCKSGLYHLVIYLKKGKKEIKLTIDHIIPKALNGDDSEENYQVLCEDCNREKGDKIIRF